MALAAGWAFFRAYQPPPVNPVTHPSFKAAIYTVKLLVPAPGLGNASDWNPHGPGLAMTAGLRVLGWLLAITVIAAITHRRWHQGLTIFNGGVTESDIPGRARSIDNYA